MVEFVQQHNLDPSAFHDLYPDPHRGGLHHVALFVDDVDAELSRFEAAGHPTALRAEMNDGFVFTFVDTVAAVGHMVELYEPRTSLTDFYAMVADAAGFRGGDLLTTIQFS